MSKLIEADVVIMGSGVAGMGAAYKLANAGGLKVAVFEKYPAQGGSSFQLSDVFLFHTGHPGGTKKCIRGFGKIFKLCCKYGADQ
jgi:glycine/D-amino acid oxidase-like deaminating enzyme